MLCVPDRDRTAYEIRRPSIGVTSDARRNRPCRDTHGDRLESVQDRTDETKTECVFPINRAEPSKSRSRERAGSGDGSSAM